MNRNLRPSTQVVVDGKLMVTLILFILTLIGCVLSEVVIPINQAQEGHVEAGNSVIYKFENIPELATDNSTLSFIVTTLSGDADIYVSTTGAPDFTNPNTYQWKSVIQDGTDTVTLSKTTEGYKSGGPYYVAVNGFQGPAMYTIIGLHSDNHVKVVQGFPQNVFVGSGQYVYFSYDVTSNGLFTISVTSLYGEANLYVSTTNQKPDASSYNYKKESLGDDFLSITHSGEVPTTYYIGIKGDHSSQTQFSLQITSPDVQDIIADGIPLYARLYSRSTTYYKFFLSKVVQDLTITADRRTMLGDPDIFVSRLYQYPNSSACEWSHSLHGTSSIQISEPEHLYPGWFYIAIHDDSVFSTDYALYISSTFAHTRLSNGLPLSKQLIGYKTDYYAYYVEPNNLGGFTTLDIFVTSASGVPLNVYGSTINRYPNENSHDLVGTFNGASFVLHKDDSPSGMYYVAVTSTTNSNYTIVVSSANRFIELVDTVQYSYTVNKRDYRKFVLPISDNSVDVSFSLSTISGDADMYISTNQLVDRANYKWKAASYARNELIHIAANDPLRHSPEFDGSLYVAVYGYAASSFSIVAYLHTGQPIELESGVPVYGVLENDMSSQNYKYYLSTTRDLRIVVQPGSESHDPDIYVSRTNPNPGPSSYDYRSISVDDDVVSIPSAQPGNYFISVYTFFPNTSYILTVSAGSMELRTFGIPIIDTVAKGQTKDYYSILSTENFVIGVTLIDGNTNLKITNNTFTKSDNGYPGNYVSLSASEITEVGTWKTSVYGVEDSTYYIHASSLSFQAELKVGLPVIGEAFCCGETGSLFAYNGILVSNTDYLVYVNSLYGEDSFTAVYVDQYPNTNPTPTSHKWSAQGSDDLIVKLPANQLDVVKSLYISVYSYRGLARFHVTLEQSGAPIFLTSDSPNYVFGNPDQSDYFKVMSLRNSAGLNAVLESCNDLEAAPFYVSNINPQPTQNNSYVSQADGKFRQIITTTKSETNTFYYIGTSKLQHALPYTMFATTGTDKRPIPKNNGVLIPGPLMSVNSKRISVPSVEGDSQGVSYLVYKRILTPQEDPANVNMQTLCAIKEEAQLVGEIATPPSGADFVDYDVPVGFNERSVINVIAKNSYGVSSAYKPIFIGIDNNDYLIDGVSLLSSTNETNRCSQFIFTATLLDTETVSFIVTPFSGDADLFIANKPQASESNFVYASRNHGFDIVSFTKGDPKYFPGPYYIGVCGLNDGITEFSIIASTSNNPIKLKDGQPQLMTTKTLDYSYFTFDLEGSDDFTVTVTPLTGDPDAYLSTNPKPSTFSFMWSSEQSAVEIINVKSSDNQFKPDVTYHLSIFAFSADTIYSVVITRNTSISTLMHGVSMGGRVQSPYSSYYRFKLTHPSNVTITVNPLNSLGDPDIFVSTHDNNQYPDFLHHDFYAFSRSVDTLTIKTTDQGWRMGWYYIAVAGYREQTEFEITVSSSDEVIVLEDGVSLTTSSYVDEWKYYAFFYGFDANSLTFSVRLGTGMRSEMVCSKTNSHPSRDKYDFLGENTGAELLAVIPEKSSIGWYYCGVHTFTASDYSITAFTNQRARLLQDATMSTNNNVRAKYYVYFTYTLPPFVNMTDINIVAYMNQGDGDLYVSTKTNRPTDKNYQWHSTSSVNENLVIAKSDIGSDSRELFIGVHGWSNALFDIVVYGLDTVLDLKENSPVLGDSQSNSYKRYSFKLENRGVLRIDLSVLSAYPSDCDFFVSMTPYPTKNHYTWKSDKFGDDTLQIDEAEAGTYYISVYTTFIASSKFSLTVSSAYSLVNDGGQILDFVDSGAVRRYKILIPEQAASISITTVGINGRTVMYASNNETFPTKDYFVASSDTVHGNGILVLKSDSIFATGVWTVSVYGITPASFYLSYQTSQGILRAGVPRVGITTLTNTAKYLLPISSAQPLSISARVFDVVNDCIMVNAYQNPSVKASAKSDPRINNGVLLEYAQISSTQLLTVEVSACSNRVQYEIVVAAKDQPTYLSQDYYSLFVSEANTFDIYSPKSAQALTVQYDSCDSTSIKDTLKVFIGKNRIPTSQDFDQVGVARNRYSSNIVVQSAVPKANYYVTTVGTSPQFFSLFTTTSSPDPRPEAVPFTVKPTNTVSKDGKTQQEYSVSIDVPKSKDHTTFYKVVAYGLSEKHKGQSDEQVMSSLNFHTLCAINSKSNLQTVGYGNSLSSSLTMSLFADEDYIVNIITSYGESGQLQQVSTPIIIRRNDSAVSPGGIILLILVILVVLYLSIGSIVKVVKYKARGAEIIPNTGFWKEVFSLFWEGCQFVFLCEMFRRRQTSEYDTMDEEGVAEDNSINNPDAYQNNGEQDDDDDDINPFAHSTRQTPENGYTTII
ncbi:predicted protein [Naegleria gruberi]|uniref:Predicted protein n=1 Tax=Naegleria gruberi TaxID=5762 RepID=D2VRM5_NAEGR|nr:uncharacterized protein NAEGRDRAFT_80990 [Naegleria gruberi]EFC40418.1 predicted protein [Naegleria gruberi]|eukprot:XP_002673162.1 predicted protein [Naegleria gruberi strain NEG-M]